jgi:hypothetical protein
MPCRFEAKGSVAKRPAEPFAQPEPTHFGKDLSAARFMVQSRQTAADLKSVFERDLGSFALLVSKVILCFKIKTSFVFLRAKLVHQNQITHHVARGNKSN